jgi:hypothetical protein
LPRELSSFELCWGLRQAGFKRLLTRSTLRPTSRWRKKSNQAPLSKNASKLASQSDGQASLFRLLEQEIVAFVAVVLLPQPAKPSRKQAHSANQRLITKRRGSAMQASAGAEGRNLWTVNPAKNPPTTQEPERHRASPLLPESKEIALKPN